jgi:hypothetical protein
MRANPSYGTHPPRKAPTGLRTGTATVASFRRRADAWKARDVIVEVIGRVAMVRNEGEKMREAISTGPCGNRGGGVVKKYVGGVLRVGNVVEEQNLLTLKTK